MNHGVSDQQMMQQRRGTHVGLSPPWVRFVLSSSGSGGDSFSLALHQFLIGLHLLGSQKHTKLPQRECLGKQAEPFRG